MPKLIVKALIVLSLLSMHPWNAQDDEKNNPLGLKVDHVTASVVDVDRASAWYQSVLGFQLIRHGSFNNGAFKFAELQIAGFGISLVQVAGDEARPLRSGTHAVPSWVHIVFCVADPAHLFEALQRQGVHVWTQDGDSRKPVVEFLISDSEGNEIEILPAKAGG